MHQLQDTQEWWRHSASCKNTSHGQACSHTSGTMLKDALTVNRTRSGGDPLSHPYNLCRGQKPCDPSPKSPWTWSQTYWTVEALILFCLWCISKKSCVLADLDQDVSCLWPQVHNLKSQKGGKASKNIKALYKTAFKLDTRQYHKEYTSNIFKARPSFIRLLFKTINKIHI